MKVGINCGCIGPYASGDFLRRSAQAAERGGFSSYWLPEHALLFAEYPESTYPYNSSNSREDTAPMDPDAPLKFGEDNPLPDPRSELSDPVVAMTWIAAATSTIEIGTHILILPQRNPVVLAKELATLDAFSGGRIVLGAGVGWAKEEMEALGVDYSKRGKLTDEYMAAMRALWSDGPSSFSGETIQFKDAYSYPKPARAGGIPILFGGESQPALKRIARAGDGWLPVMLPVDDAAQIVSNLKEMTKQNGRDPEHLRIICLIFTTTPDDHLIRYREAGVTEFLLAASGQLPAEGPGVDEKIAEFGQLVVDKVKDW